MENTGTSFAIPRTLADLASFLHGYVIKAGGEGNEPRRLRAVNLEGLAETLPKAADADHAYAIVQLMHRQAAELAELDPDLAWLPDWRPRVAVPMKGER